MKIYFSFPVFSVFTAQALIFLPVLFAVKTGSLRLIRSTPYQGKFLVNHAPAFNPSNYSYNISEESSLDMLIGAVRATDSDGDQLSFSFKTGNTNKAFKINSSTGSITLARRLFYHAQSEYVLIVKVTDPGGLSAEALVGVNVKAKVIFPNFWGVTWGTVKNQPYGTHEIHGDVVNGKLYCFGGFDELKRPNYTPTKRAFVYDPLTNTWAAIADLPHNPRGAKFGGITNEGLTNDGTDIYFAGGFTSNTTGGGQVFGSKEVFKYSVSSNTYSALPSLPVELAAGQLRYCKGKIHYIGGTNKLRKDVNVHYALNLDSIAAGWKVLAPLGNARNRAGSAVYNGKIYFIGGSHFINEKAVSQNTVEVYDPTANNWKRVADLPVARYHIASSVVVFGSRIIVLGGETSSGIKSNLVSAYSPASNSWENLTSLPGNRAAGIAGILQDALYYSGGNFSNIIYKGAPIINPPTLSIDSFTLINADTDQSLQVLSNGNTLNLSTLPTTQLNIRTHPNPANVGSVLFKLSGLQNLNVTDNQFPYTVFGDAAGDYHPWTLPVGQYTLKATPYSGSEGTGTAGTPKTVTFNVISETTEKITLLPIADAFIRNGAHANTNYGKETSLAVKTITSGGFTRQTYLKFSLAGITSVGSATVRKYGRNTSDAAGVSLALYSINNDSWTETGIKFNNAPAPASSPLSLVVVTSTLKYYDIDVTSFVKGQLSGDKIVSFFIRDPENNNKKLEFNSREHVTYAPQLLIEQVDQNKPLVKRLDKVTSLYTLK